MPEQFANNAEASLTASLTPSATSMSVDSKAGFPSAFPFRGILHDEIIIVTGDNGPLGWHVTRGAEGTGAKAHAYGSRFYAILSAGALTAFRDELLEAVGGADLSGYYTAEEIDAALAGKSNAGHDHDTRYPLLVGSNSWSGAQTFSPPSGAAIPVTVRGATSQTADLLQLQNSSATVLARVGAAGELEAKAFRASVSTATAGRALTAAEASVLANALAGAFTLTLPSAAAIAGHTFTIKKTDTSSNNVIVAADTGQNIDGKTNYVLEYPGEFVQLLSDGSSWNVIGE